MDFKSRHRQILIQPQTAGLDPEIVEAPEEFSICRERYVQVFNPADMQAAEKWCNGLERDHEARARQALLRMRGAQRRVQLIPDDWRDRLAGLGDTFPNFGRILAWIGTQLALCELGGDRVLKLPPFLLAGPPGVGKTEFLHQFADTLDTEFYAYDFATAHGTHGLAGSEPHWGNSQEGALWRWLAASNNANFIAMFDELDKCAAGTLISPATNILFSLLEPRTAAKFVDCSQPLLSVNLSYAIWTGACNEPDRLDPALRQRFREFRIEAPTRDQSAAIVHSVFNRLCAANNWGRHFDVLPPAVVECLQELPPRKIKQRLTDGCGFAARAGRLTLEPADVSDRWSDVSMLKQRIGFL